MKDLSYISITAREGIIRAYSNLWNLQKPSELEGLEEKLFGYPAVRVMVDQGIEEANKQVDLERYSQWSEPWFQTVVQFLPVPGKLDEYQGSYKSEESFALPPGPKKKVKDYISTIEGYKQFRNKVDYIILNFDFQKVHDVMEMLDWKWASWYDESEDQHTNEVPSVYALRTKAHQMLLDAVEKNCGGSGGFEVRTYVYDLVDENGVPYTPDEPDDFEHSVHLSLKFVVEEQGTVY